MCVPRQSLVGIGLRFNPHPLPAQHLRMVSDGGCSIIVAAQRPLVHWSRDAHATPALTWQILMATSLDATTAATSRAALVQAPSGAA